jgi:hypothetical protein
VTSGVFWFESQAEQQQSVSLRPLLLQVNKETTDSLRQYFGTTVTKQHYIGINFKKRFKFGKVCRHSLRIVLSSRFLPKNLRIKVHKSTVSAACLRGCETCFKTCWMDKGS